MKKYESMVIIIPSISEDDAVQENEKLLSFIEKNGGEIVKTEKWGKRKLSYEIKKYKEGYYFVNFFSLDPNRISEFENEYRINENIIRYNILAK
jgi:small subunit ribosomal protein S6